MLVDSHCHINFPDLFQNLDSVLSNAQDSQVSHMLCVAVNLEDFPQILQLSQQHKNIFASVGVHPCYKDVKEPTVEELVSLAKMKEVIAVGETGLDYFRTENEDMQWQQERFVRHIHAAITVDKPLIIHTRNAQNDTMAFLKQEGANQPKGVMHCFAEDWEIAKLALDLGFYISFSGIVTFKNAHQVQDVAKKCPLDRILVETDAPYLAPTPHRGKLNEPALVTHTAQFIADLKGISYAEIARVTTNNFFTLFKSAENPQ